MSSEARGQADSTRARCKQHAIESRDAPGILSIVLSSAAGLLSSAAAAAFAGAAGAAGAAFAAAAAGGAVLLRRRHGARRRPKLVDSTQLRPILCLLLLWLSYHR